MCYAAGVPPFILLFCFILRYFAAVQSQLLSVFIRSDGEFSGLLRASQAIAFLPDDTLVDYSTLGFDSTICLWRDQYKSVL